MMRSRDLLDDFTVPTTAHDMKKVMVPGHRKHAHRKEVSLMCTANMLSVKNNLWGLPASPPRAAAEDITDRTAGGKED
jgi:hypothetical protein